MSYVLDTFKGFKLYETVSFVSFLYLSVIFLIDIEFLSLIVSSCACIWTFTSSGYRQMAGK